MLGRTDRHRRMVALILVFAIFGGAATVRLGYWQVVAAEDLTARAARTMVKPAPPPPPRAQILDRNGRVLAQSATLDQLEVHPNLVPVEKREEMVRTLATILGLGSSKAREAYLAKLAGGRKWERLERQITPEHSIDIRLAKDKGLLPGITLTPQRVRVYPRKGGQDDATLANQLIGFVDASGNGMYGIERLYDDRLSGQELSQDVASIGGADVSTNGSELPPLELTLDLRLQRQVESELFAARLVTGAKSVSAMVMDPRSGAILASASVPGYDANDFASVAKQNPGRMRDRVVSDFFEPGSVMKIFTVGAALDLGVITPQTKIRDEVKLEFYDDVIRNSDHGSKGLKPVRDHIAYSRNNVAAKVAQRLAPNDHQKASRRLFRFWERVGVVGETGVDIANEATGLVYDTEEYKWARVDLANRSFGQGVAVTLVQLARGISTLVNGGYLIQPHVVADNETAAAAPERVISAKVARQAQDMLVHVTGSVPWYASGSLIEGYMIGGKTGTAQIWDSTKHKWKDVFNHNFIGFVGSDQPEAVIVLRIEEPKVKTPKQGVVDSKVESYELFRMLAIAAIKHLDIKRSSDPNAGLPILGTDAARALTPQRVAQARQRSARARSDKQARTNRKGAGSRAARAESGGSGERRRKAGNRQRTGGGAAHARSGADVGN